MPFNIDEIISKYLEITKTADCDKYGQIKPFSYRISLFCAAGEEAALREFLKENVHLCIHTYANQHFTYEALTPVSHEMGGMVHEAAKQNSNITRALNTWY